MNDRMEKIPMSEIHVDFTFNNREPITSTSVAELMANIETNGLIQPIVVREFLDGEETFDKKYDLVAGFRRCKAVQMLQYDVIQAVIKSGIPRSEAVYINISENIARKQLSILEESDALVKMIEMDEYTTREKICKKLSVSVGWFQPRMYLAKMPQDIKDLAHQGWLGKNAIRDLNSLMDNPEQMATEIRRLKDRAHSQQEAGGTPMLLKIKIAVKDDGKNPAATPKKHSKKETDAVLEYLSDYGFGGHFFLKAMAWCSGNINDLEFCALIKEYADEEGKTFEYDSSGFTEVLNKLRDL